MTDPFGRDRLPEEPRKPRRWDPLRPLRQLIWLWLLPYETFDIGYKPEVTDGAIVAQIPWVVTFIALMVFVSFAVVTITDTTVGLVHLWGRAALAFGSFWMVQLVVRLWLRHAMHLDDEKIAAEWKERFRL